MTEATQNLIDEANATAYILSIMAESAESLSTDTGMAEALNGMMLRLFEAARDCEQAEQDAEKDGIVGTRDLRCERRGGTGMTTLEMCDTLNRIDSKLDVALTIFASAENIDVAAMSDGLCFVVADIQSELASIREERSKDAKPTERADEKSG